MAKRKIITINQKKCTGCGLCIPNCPEGALQMIDGKARLISDLFCDGLGACIGHCPEGAITIEEREAEPYKEKKVMENIVKQGENVIKAHLEHLRDHGANDYLKDAVEFLKEKNIKNPLETKKEGCNPNAFSGCPGTKVMDFGKTKKDKLKKIKTDRAESELRQWPIQLMLVPPFAPYLKNANLVIAADCAPFAYANFHEDFLKNKVLLIGCPKLDDVAYYREKIASILKGNDINSITCVHMEVPCCFGLVSVVKEAIEKSGKKIPFCEETISINGERK
jgi:ferredoxin